MKDRQKEIAKFLPYWIDKPKSQVVEEIASYSLETKRVPDPYYFLINTYGKLISPQTGRFVEDSVERQSPVGQLEYQALLKIQEWTMKDEKSTCLWISPPYPGKYPVAKIIVSEKVNRGSREMLFNRAILLDFDNQECLVLAQKLASIDNGSSTFTSPEDLRAQPIFLNSKDQKNWLTLLRRHVNGDKVWDTIESGEDIMKKDEVLKKASIIYQKLFGHRSLCPSGYDDFRLKKVVKKAQLMDLFGTSLVSCPPSSLTAFETFSKNAFLLPESKFVKNCGQCGAKIEKVISAGFRCPCCGGTYEGC